MLCFNTLYVIGSISFTVNNSLYATTFQYIICNRFKIIAMLKGLAED